jgi:hypothetical protein
MTVEGSSADGHYFAVERLGLSGVDVTDLPGGGSVLTTEDVVGLVPSVIRRVHDAIGAQGL